MHAYDIANHSEARTQPGHRACGMEWTDRVPSGGRSSGGSDERMHWEEETGRDDYALADSADMVQSNRRCGSNSAVECHLAKVDVAGSNPVSRSKQEQGKNAVGPRTVHGVSSAAVCRVGPRLLATATMTCPEVGFEHRARVLSFPES
jgi:hypothetical protein